MDTAEERTGERTALVLEAGGARSAYQVGALQVLLPALAEQGPRPAVMVGTSAGALITGALAATAHLDPEEQAVRLLDVLQESTKKNVMRPLWQQGPTVLARYASETLGASFYRLRGLVGTGPLARTLQRSIDWDRLHRNVQDGLVESASVCATSVRTGWVTMFTESAPSVGPLPSPRREHQRRYAGTRLGVEHLMASAAIPVLFPSVKVTEPPEAAGWYLDGATRRRVPLAPALELGADRVVVVGTGSLDPTDPDPEQDQAAVDLGDGGATLLGAVMDDPLRHDLRRLAAINGFVSDADVARHLNEHRAKVGRPPFRETPYVAVAPRTGWEIADVAMEVFRANHGSLRRSLFDPDLQLVHRLLGSDSPLQGELLSYLLFDPDFFGAVADLGRRDAATWVAENPDLWRTGPLDPVEEPVEEPA